MFHTIKFFIRDQYYALINRLWRRIAAKTGNGNYWKAIVDHHMTQEVS